MAVSPDDPVQFARLAFGHDHWETSDQIIRAVFHPRSRTAVKACHASSKSYTAADCIAIALQQGADVLTTAPTWEQVRTVLWGAVRRTVLATPHLDWGEVNQTEITTPEGAHAIGLSTNEGVRFQGWHARPGSYLLVVKDEAPGVRPDIYEAIEGISAGGDVRQLDVGNPVVSSGPFYDIFATAAPGWTRITIDAFDTPNLRGLTLADLLALPEHELDNNVRPYLVTRRWVVDRYREWGEDHPLWQSRVRGQFPEQSEDALFSLTWLEAAKLRDARRVQDEPIMAGIDVAGPGEDETVVYVRQGRAILACETWAKADPRGDVVNVLQRYVPSGLAQVNVDSSGIGWNFYLHLKDVLPESVTVSPVNAGEASDVTDDHGEKRFVNKKAELYWGFRERVSSGRLDGLTDQTTIGQLAGIRYEHDSRGRVEIESKDKARKRGVKSPDRAEALILAFADADPWANIGSYQGVSVPVGGRIG